MTQPDDDKPWPHRLARSVGREIRRRRDALDLSAQQVSDACAERGCPIPRNVLANLESGRRPMVTVAELFVLGQVLRVPPILLLFPVDGQEQVEIAPDRIVALWPALKWFIGEAPMPGDTTDWGGGSTKDSGTWLEGAQPLINFREYERLIAALAAIRGAAVSHRVTAGRAATDVERDALLAAAGAEEQRAREVEQEIREHLDFARAAGIDLPDPPAYLHLDLEERTS